MLFNIHIAKFCFNFPINKTNSIYIYADTEEQLIEYIKLNYKKIFTDWFWIHKPRKYLIPNNNSFQKKYKYEVLTLNDMKAINIIKQYKNIVYKIYSDTKNIFLSRSKKIIDIRKILNIYNNNTLTDILIYFET